MLEKIADRLWAAEHDLFIGPARIHFRGRMTVVRLTDSSLLLHSPIPIDEPLAEELGALGEVRHLVAPNCFHHLYLPAAKRRFSNARVYAPAGIEKKRTDVDVDETLGTAPPTAWRADLAQEPVAGMPAVNEAVFFHPATRSLLVTDLVFNIHQCQGWLTPWILRLSGTYGRLAQSRLFRTMIKDRQQAAASAERILAWDFDRLIPAHGKVVETGAKEPMRHALARMAGGS